MAAEPSSAGFSVSITALLGAVLLLPMLIKTTIAEPFPAVLLPSGAGLVPLIDGRVQFEYVSLFAYDEAGALKKIAPLGFVDPMPVHFIPGLIRNRFGQGTEVSRTVRALGRDLHFDRPQPTAAEREQARAWLREKLRARGLADQVLIARVESSTVVLSTGEDVAKVVRDEQAFPLR
jgi:hypothetical protein